MHKVLSAVILCFMVVGVSSQFRTCLQGTQQALSGITIPSANNSLEARACADDGLSYSCHRFDISGTLIGLGLQSK